MTKISKITIFFAILFSVFATTIFLQASQSSAADAKNSDITVYNPGTYKCEKKDGQLVEALIDCIKTPIKAAVLKSATSGSTPASGIGPIKPDEIGLLAFVSQYIANLMKYVVMLAVVLYGVKIFNVRNNPYTVGLGTLIKLGIAFILIANMGGFAPKLYDAYDEIVNMGNASNTTIWAQIDLFLSDLLGFTTGARGSIKEGIIALLNGSIFAKSLGVMLSLIGVFAVANLLMLILQTMYLYLASFMAFSFLICLGPLFILFFIFGYTERFFSKWFELIITTFLTPLLLFAFLGIFINETPPQNGSTQPTPGLIKQAVIDVFVALGNGNYSEGKNYVKRCLLPAQPLLSSFLLPTDSNLADKMACPPPLLPGCNEQDRNNSSVQTWLNSSLFRAYNNTPFTMATIDCGQNDDKIKEETFKALTILFLYATFITSMLYRIPGIATDLANGLSVGMSGLSSSLSNMFNLIK